MKLDLLKKLTALANNNPNENEANLAARKVCLMLAEAKFNLGNGTPVAKTASKSYHTGSGTWNDVKRSEEPQFSSSRQSPREPNLFWDFFNRAYGEPSWHIPKEPRNDPYKSKKEESSQTKENPFTESIIFDIDPEYIDKIYGGRAGGGKTKGFKDSEFKNYNPIDDSLDTNCIICKKWFRISKTLFEQVKGCYVCDSCKGKDK